MRIWMASCETLQRHYMGFFIISIFLQDPHDA